MYFWTGLHKLNYGFFDLEHSCAIYFNQEILNLLNLRNNFINPIYLISSVLSIELIVPFMFLFSKLRLPAIIIMSAFHLLLAPLGFYDFSFICFTLYTLFNLNTKFNDKIVQFAAALAFMSLLTSLIVLGFGVLVHKQYILIVTSSVFIQALIIYELIRKRDCVKKFKFTYSKMLLVIFLIINLHALSPYLGLYTGGTFNMFSNLRTEYNLWNHILFPNELRVFNMQNDLYLYEPNFNKSYFSRYEPHENSLITFNHAQLILNDHKRNNYPLPKIFSNDGSILEYKYLGIVERKLSNFRTVPIDKACSW